MENVNANFSSHEDRDIEELLIRKAWESEEFKELLVKDPKAAIKQAFPGMVVPENIEIVVHENKSNVINFVLPKKSEYAAAQQY